MVDNTNNYYHVAPDKGTHDGPAWQYSGSLNKYLNNLQQGYVMRGGYHTYNGTSNANATKKTPLKSPAFKTAASSSSYWMATLGSKGSVRIILCVIDY